MNEFERIETEYLGLPIPMPGEVGLLSRAIDESLVNEYTLPEQLFDELYARNPRLEEMIHSSVASHYDLVKDVPGVEDNQKASESYTNIDEQFYDFFNDGVWEGYKFTLGSFLLMHVIRSGITNKREFFTEAEKTGVLPIATQEEQIRVEEVIRGLSIFPNGKKDETAYDAMQIEVSKYMLAAETFEELFAKKLAALKSILGIDINRGFSEEEASETTAITEGFCVGVSHAIVMCIQCHEQRIVGEYAAELVG